MRVEVEEGGREGGREGGEDTRGHSSALWVQSAVLL